MKQLKLMKTLLVAVGLLLGTSAWAANMTTMTGLLGLTDNSNGFNVYQSKVITIAAGESYQYTLINYNKGSEGTDIWENWFVEGRRSDNSHCFDFRADGGHWLWCPDGQSQTLTENYTGNSSTDVSATATEWLSAYNGVTVTITISRSNDGNTMTVEHSATVNESSYSGTFTSTGFGTGAATFLISNEDSHQIIQKVAYTPASGKTITYLYDQTLSGWSTADVTTTEGTVNKWYCANGIAAAEANDGMRINATYGLENHKRGKGGVNTATLILDRTKDVITIDAVWNVGTATNDGLNMYNMFQYGDFSVQYFTDSRTGTQAGAAKTQYTINGVTTQMTKAARMDALTIHLKVNSVSGSISEFYIKNGETTLAQYSDLTASNNSFAGGANYNKIITTSYCDANGTSVNNYLTSIVVTEEESEATYSTVTFTYATTGGTSLSSIRSDVVVEDVEDGTAILSLITDAYKTTFYSGDGNARYTYSTYSVPEDATVVNGDVTVTLKFAEAAKFTHTVQAVDGSENVLNGTLASGNAYAGESINLYWSKYIYADSKWWECNSPYGGTYTTSGTTSVTYTEADIDYFFEAEDMTYSRTYNTYEGTSASNGSAKTLYGDANAVTTTTVAAGVYTVSLNGIKWADGYVDTYQIAYSTDGAKWTPVGTITYADGEEGVKTLAGAIIPTTAYIRIWTTGGVQTPRRYLDYMTFQKTADLPNNVSKTITSAGWATYCSPYVLDFSSSIDNLTAAYLVTGGEEGVLTLSEITGKVPARTGILLKGSGDCTIPVATSSDVSTTDNKLEGVISETPGVAAGIYVLMNINSKVGFYQTENAFTVGANTAYLPSNFAGSGSGDARAFYLFDEDATGINAVSTTKAETGDYYNLAGQRVAQPTKGLYIVNGKKYVVK